MNVRWKLALIALSALLALAATISLGRWQLSRADQKLTLQAAMDGQNSKSALDSTALLSGGDLTPLLYQRARLRGTWVREATVFLDNRQMNDRVGFFAMTPLLLEGGRAAILVQRGWVPRNFADRAQLPAVVTPTGTVEIEGHIAPAPSKLYEPGRPSGGPIRQNLDLKELAADSGLPLLAVSLRQTGSSSEGLLREWPPVNLGVDKHYGYAFQWFGLAGLIAVLFLWFQMIRPFIQRRKDPSRHV